ncbi:hypothetical protein ACFXG3_28050 [Nocardia tengchongensis]|uniref:hypothetical protein n=1 Tax=Nocardia tengchongensis TaxID=2055889 RepID=UPI0036BA0A77
MNQALSAATTCLYGIAHAVVVGVRCSPGLGFVRTGHERSFVFDLADLYKAEFAIPIAFDVAVEGPDDIGATTSRAVRDVVHAGGLLSRCCKDIYTLLLPDAPDAAEEWDADVVELWDLKGNLAGGISYDDEEVPWWCSY